MPSALPTRRPLLPAALKKRRQPLENATEQNVTHQWLREAHNRLCWWTRFEKSGPPTWLGEGGVAVVLTPNYGAEWVHRLRVKNKEKKTKKRSPSNPNRNEQGDTSPSLRIPQALLSFPKFDTSLAAPPTAFLLSKCGPSRRTYWVWGRQSA